MMGVHPACKPLLRLVFAATNHHISWHCQTSVHDIITKTRNVVVVVRLNGVMRMVVIVTNRLSVNEAYAIDFEDRFKKRVHLVDQSPGFIRNEVHRPKPMKFEHETGVFIDDPDQTCFYEVKTWWQSFADFQAWVNSDMFKEAHANRPPKDMFTGPSKILVHEIVTSTDIGH